MKRLLLCALLATSAFAAEPQPPGWLGMGVTYHTSTDRNGAVHGWLFIRNLEPNGPAARAGLHVQDVIQAIDGKPLTYRDEPSMLAALSKIRPRQTMRLTVKHEAATVTRDVVAAELPERARRAWKANYELLKKPR